MKFEREYLCQFESDPDYEYAYRLWVEYYFQTEEYDRRVCSGRKKFGRGEKVAIAANGFEYALSVCFANRLRSHIEMVARAAKIPYDVFLEAKKTALRNSHQKNAELLEEWTKDEG